MSMAEPLGFVAAHDRERLRFHQETHRIGLHGPSQHQFEGVRKDGTVIEILASTDNVLWRGRQTFQSIAIDITKQMTAERSLSATAISFRDVADGSLQGFFVTQYSLFVHVNQAFVDSFGYSEGELKPKPVFDFYAPHERKRINHYWLRRLGKSEAQEVYEVDAIRSDGQTIRLQQCVRRVDNWRAHLNNLEQRRPLLDFRYSKISKNGRVYHTSVGGIPVFNNAGEFEGYRGAATNINKEVEALQALAKERNLLRAIIDNIPDAIYAKDRDARFVLEYDFDSSLKVADAPYNPIGKTDFDCYPAQIAEALYRDDLQVIESGRPIINKVEQLVRSEDDEPVWLSTTKVPLRDPKGEVTGLVGIGRDIA